MPATIDDAGEFLADVRALEAAGAKLIGIEGNGREQAILPKGGTQRCQRFQGCLPTDTFIFVDHYRLFALLNRHRRNFMTERTAFGGRGSA